MGSVSPTAWRGAEELERQPDAVHAGRQNKHSLWTEVREGVVDMWQARRR